MRLDRALRSRFKPDHVSRGSLSLPSLHCASALAIGAALLMSAPANAQPATAPVAASLAANPLIGPWNTPDGVPPYDRITAAHYVPAFDEGMRQARAELAH